MVKDAMTRHARKLGTRQMQVQGFRSEDVATILAAFASGSSLGDLRDRAVILVAHDAALRSAELLALTVEDLDQAKEGRGVILIRKSKTDQVGRGSEQLVSPAAMTAIRAWLEEAGLQDGPIFRSLERDGVTLRDKAMSRVGYYKMIQARAAAVGMSGSTHSFRVGFGQDMWARGANPLQAMKVGRWKDPATYNRYGERAEVELSIAADRFLK
jgi:integrase